MMMKSFLAAAVFAALPLAASAVTLEPDTYDYITGGLTSGQTVSFEFTPSTTMDVEFSVATTGFEDDLETVTFGTSYSTEKSLWVFTPTSLSYGGGKIDFTTVDDVFSFFLTAGETTNPIGYTISWVTQSPAPVPLPAAGLLLGAAVMGLGVAAKRRRNT